MDNHGHVRTVAALFCHRRSPYKAIAGVEVYDLARDARTFPGGMPVIAHPPCRYWSRARRRDLPTDPDEVALAPWALNTVRQNGGILEHPFGSRFWSFARLPAPGCQDEFGGWTIQLDQLWFGHPAEKSTWLYLFGIAPPQVAPVLVDLTRRPRSNFNCLSRSQRQLSPPRFAEWLVSLARVAAEQVATCCQA